MSKLFSIFDQATIGASLALSNSNMVVTTIANSLSVNRMVRCLYPMSAFNGDVEWLVYGTGSLTNLAYGGVVDASAVTTKYVGQDTHGYGFKWSDGTLRNNGSTVATASDTLAKGDVGHMVYNAADLSLKFYKGDTLILSYTLPSSGPWYPACSLGSTTAGDLAMFMNAGQQAFQNPRPGASGWWSPVADINPVRLASEDFTAPTTDTVPNAIYDGVISAATSVAVVRSVAFWPWRNSPASVSGGQSYGSITIDDPLEQYGALLSLDIRDAAFVISRVVSQEDSGSVDTAQTLSTGVVDRVDTAGDFGKVIYIKDGLAILDLFVQRSLFLPNVDASAVGQPLPIVAGCARSVPGILIDNTNTTTPKYQFTDQPIAQIGSVRVAGKVINFPTDWTFNADHRGITTAAAVQGKFTADISTVGGAVSGLTSLLISGGQDYGNFTNGTIYTTGSDLLTYWDVGGYGLNVPAWVGSGTDPNYTYPRLEMGPQGGSGTGTYIKTKTAIITAGNSYTAEIHIKHIPAQAIHASIPAYLFVALVASYAVTDGLGSTFNPNYVDYGVDTLGNYVVYLTFTNTTGSNQKFVLGFQANNVSGIHTVGLAKIESVKLYDLGNAASVVSLTGTTLYSYCQLMIETEGGLSSGVWQGSDAAAIDTATGFTSLGNYINRPTSIRNALQPALDSYCADAFVYRAGKIGIVRLVDPGTLSSSGSITEDVIQGSVNTAAAPSGVHFGSTPSSMIAMTPDQAIGLTTKMSGRRNWSVYTDGDFGSTSLTDATNATRALLKQAFQFTVASGAQLSRSYLYAQQAQALASCFDSSSEAQTEIDRVCALYTTLRYFYAVPVKSDSTDTYEIGQAWQLVYPRYGLSAGKPVLIIGITEDPVHEQLTLICWG